MGFPALDHIVVDTKDRLDDSMRIYQDLGFQLTPRGYHSIGSANHLAIFGTNYLELLGFGTGSTVRPELARYPIGLNGLVFKTDNAEDTFRRAMLAGIPALGTNAFSRPVEVDGRKQDARFRTTSLRSDASDIGRVYFCEHQTPELIWRNEWQVHPNGAQEIVSILIAARDPTRQAELFVRMFGQNAVEMQPDGTASLMLSTGGTIVLASVADTLGPLGGTAPDPAGRTDFMAAIVIRVGSLSAAAHFLRDVPGFTVENHRLIIPATAALNATILLKE